MTAERRARSASASISAELDAEALLPRTPGVFRRWMAAHPKAVDWIIVGSYLAGCLLILLFAAGYPSGLTHSVTDIGPVTGAPLDDAALPGAAPAGTTGDPYSELTARVVAEFLKLPWLFVVIATVAATAIALRLRRSHPLGGLIAVSSLQIFEQGMLVLPNAVAIYFLLFAIPVHRSVRSGWIGWGVSSLITIVLTQLGGGTAIGFVNPAGIFVAEAPFRLAPFTSVGLVNAIWMLAILLLGINLGNRRRYVQALIDRAHQLVRDREQREQIAAGAERARIAREMHDVVAHSLSVVVTLSEAAAVAIDSRPDQARQAAARAAETGREALGEMRRLLGVLNEAGESAALQPQPGIAELPELMAGFAAAGLRVSCTETGDVRGESAQQLAVYRIVQEGLTNALRYAGPGASVLLTLRHLDSATEIEVLDSGPRAASGSAMPGREAGGSGRGLGEVGSGRGIAGAEQRAELFGGRLSAGPSGKGWLLSARVPLTPNPMAQGILPS